MLSSRYFRARYFNARYFSATGATVVDPDPTCKGRVRVTPVANRVQVTREANRIEVTC